MATGLALAGCDGTPENFAAPEKPVDPPVNGQADTHVQVDAPPVQQEKRGPAPTGEKEKTRKPLNLSLPPQPVVVTGSRDNIDASGEQLLPDLFQQDQKADDGGSTHIRGRVLMKQGEEQNLDSLEGGQLIIEKKTR
jgi:hypothetical protein